MTNTALKAQIDSQITNETTPSSVSPTDVGTNLKALVDYVDQQVPLKTSGAITLSATTQVLPYDTNSCSFTGGKAYLPAVSEINKEIYVIATSNNIEISANVGGTLKMFTTFNTFVANVVLTTNQMYRFIYIGFGSGAGGVDDGYWKAELL